LETLGPGVAIGAWHFWRRFGLGVPIGVAIGAWHQWGED